MNNEKQCNLYQGERAKGDNKSTFCCAFCIRVVISGYCSSFGVDEKTRSYYKWIYH